MRRNRGRHTDRNALRAVHKKIRNANRQNLRFFLGLVVVRDKADGLIEVAEIHFLRKLLKLRLGVTHGRSAVSLNRAEVAVAVDQRHAALKGLAHHNQGLVNRAVPVRVVFTHGIADDTRGLSVRLVMT